MQSKVAGNRKTRIAKGISVTATYDEGLLDWLGVERERDCIDGRLDSVFSPGWKGAPVVHYKPGSDAFVIHDRIQCHTKHTATTNAKENARTRRKRRWRCRNSASSASVIGRVTCEYAV